jgi:hypothetical protein
MIEKNNIKYKNSIDFNDVNKKHKRYLNDYTNNNI